MDGRVDEGGDEGGVGAAAQAAGEPNSGCAVHGVALLLASAAVIVVMATVTFGCWLLYRLVA